jgi:putative spermidine/putrescine transport system permease protein
MRSRTFTKRLAALALLAPAIALIGAVFFLPLVEIARLSFGATHFTLEHYTRIVSDRSIVQVLLNTFKLAAGTTIICAVLGLSVAYTMRVSNPRRQRIIAVLVILPLWTSIVVRSYAWVAILGREGLVNTVLRRLGLVDQPLPLLYTHLSVYLGMVQVMLPFMILPLFSVLNRIDLRLLSAAHCLGATPFAAFVTILLPLAAPGIAAGLMLVFIMSLGFFVTPAMLGGLSDITFVMLIEKEVNELLNWPLAGAMAMSLLLLSLVLLLIYHRTQAIRQPGMLLGRIIVSLLSTFPSTGHGGRYRRQAARCCAWLPSVLSVSTLCFIVVPILLIVPLAFSASPFLEFPPREWSSRWFENYFSRTDWVNATLNSLIVATSTAAIATPLGVLAAIALTRFEFYGKALFQAVIVSPLVLPTIVLAVAIYFFFVRIHIVGSIKALVLAHSLLALPYVVLVLMGALRTVDLSLEKVATTLGSRPAGAFCRITLPLIRPAILTATFFAFLASFDELVIALFIAGTKAATLPKRMWEGILLEVDPTTAAAAVLLIGLSFLSLGLVEISRWVYTRRIGVDALQVGHQILK